jgi:hypothetical protein
VLRSQVSILLGTQLQAGFILFQGYVPEKHCTNLNRAIQTQNSHLKSTAYAVYKHFYRVYTHFYTIHLYISNAIKMANRIISIVFGTVHSDRTVVVLLHKHFSYWLSTLCCSISSITNRTYTNMSEYNIMVWQKFVHFFQVGILHLISLQYYIWSVALYGSETRTLGKNEESVINAFEK